jgi:protein-tyrosine phosphatase
VTERFEVLLVCTGNVCRSPLAEQLLRERFGEHVAHFRSAGTAALVGQRMPEEAQVLSRELGGAAAELHEPRLLDAEAVERADIVLALTREHRADIARLVPRAHRTTVTLREAARLLEALVAGRESADELADLRQGSPVEALRALVPLMLAQRGMGDPIASPEDDDVIDPFGFGADVYAASGAQVVDAIDRIERTLAVVQLCKPSSGAG